MQIPIPPSLPPSLPLSLLLSLRPSLSLHSSVLLPIPNFPFPFLCPAFGPCFSSGSISLSFSLLLSLALYPDVLLPIPVFLCIPFSCSLSLTCFLYPSLLPPVLPSPCPPASGLLLVTVFSCSSSLSKFCHSLSLSVPLSFLQPVFPSLYPSAPNASSSTSRSRSLPLFSSRCPSVLLPLPGYSAFIALSHCLSHCFWLYPPVQPAVPFFLSLFPTLALLFLPSSLSSSPSAVSFFPLLHLFVLICICPCPRSPVPLSCSLPCFWSLRVPRSIPIFPSVSLLPFPSFFFFASLCLVHQYFFLPLLCPAPCPLLLCQSLCPVACRCFCCLHRLFRLCPPVLLPSSIFLSPALSPAPHPSLVPSGILSTSLYLSLCNPVSRAPCPSLFISHCPGPRPSLCLSLSLSPPDLVAVFSFSISLSCCSSLSSSLSVFFPLS
ncbi:uncharacterized protein LOC143159934 isoform X1 [Aptenodytes patagonicus]|uniref:uncharacterized protein LOC143159932 n=1 Tax=Aptenodytes patagonicus TaxID=9234 RepID=UPI003FA15396